MPRPLKVVELPKSDHRISHERNHRRASCQTVKTISQIDGIGPRGHQEVHPNHEQHDSHDLTREFETEERLLNEAHAGLGTGETGIRRQNQRQHRIYGSQNELTDELALNRQSLALLLTNLREIINKTKQSHRQHGKQHQHRRPRRSLTPRDEAVQRRRAPAQHNRQIDDHATQRRRATLD